MGETGSVDVFDVATRTFARVDGFKTVEREARGKKRMMGPSAAAAGEGFVYVSDRGSNEVCAVSDTALKLGACAPLSSPPDDVGYLASAKEVWVTTPKESSLAVFDASQPDVLKPKAVVKIDGAPECFAIDAARDLFYTNVEDKNRTVAIDVKTHAVKTQWSLGCKDDGPRGVAVDSARDFVFVACTDAIEVLDAAHDGARLGSIDVGAGVDAIEYVDATNMLYVAAAKAGRLSVLRFSDRGVPTIVRTQSTAPGARNAVVDSRGAAYVVDPNAARLIVLPSADAR